MAGVAFAVDGDGVGFATESYAASALYTTLANLSGAFWRIRRANVDINGAWGSNIGVDYQITQTGNSFRWVVERGIPGETGNGSIDGNKVRASWSGPKGSGSASGVVVVVGGPTKIEWSNGVIFLKR